MSPYEIAYCALECFMPVHYVKVRRLVRSLARGCARPQILDVGGRKSPYTCGVAADIHIIDLPRESERQYALNLGLTSGMTSDVQRRRSNIRSIRIEDITTTTLADGSFDGAVAVEVIEHVRDDSAFVSQLHRLLKPRGFLILTTPNGEGKTAIGRDHVREYARAELDAKLRERFGDVRVWCGMRKGALQERALRGWLGGGLRSVINAPFVMLSALIANLTEPPEPLHPIDAQRLFAVAKKT